MKELKKFIPISASYVRSGAFADKNAREINESVGIPPEILVFKHAPGTDRDRILFVRFNTEDLSGKCLRLTVRMKEEIYIGRASLFYEVYPVDYEGDLEALTYNTMPKLGKAAAKAFFGGFVGCDVTDVVIKAKAEGKKTICFALTATQYTEDELRLTNPVFEGDSICIEQYESASVCFLTRTLSGNKEKDDEIWGWAEKMYSEWRVRYEEMLREPKLEAELICSPEEQYTETVWHSFSPKDFDTAKKAEKTRTVAALTDIDEYVARKDYPVDEFGGLMDEDRRQEATGFFYSKKIDGRWWFIDPLGYPYVVRALSEVVPSYDRSEYQMQKTLEKFGTLENWGEITNNRLKNDLHFFASFAPDRHVSTSSSNPLVRQLQIGGFADVYGSRIGTSNSQGGSSRFSENNTMNVFDPAFVEFVDEKAKVLEASKDDPYVLGYTTDNELPMEENMIFSYLRLNPANPNNYYSYACAWTWLINMSGKDEPTNDDIKPEYFELFRGFVWDRYYNVAASAVKKYDSNHMFLGSRCLTKIKDAEWVLKFSGRYLDCITINWYGEWQPNEECIYLIAKSANCPFMITEFYTKAGDSGLGNTSGAGWYVETQKDRGMFYQNYTLRLLEAKNCIGWHWFQYLDNDPRNAIGPDGRLRDVSSVNSNKGIMSSEHEEYTECTKYMAEINRNAYRLIEYFDKKYKK